jgi:hypothetical protein
MHSSRYHVTGHKGLTTHASRFWKSYLRSAYLTWHAIQRWTKPPPSPLRHNTFITSYVLASPATLHELRLPQSLSSARANLHRHPYAYQPVQLTSIAHPYAKHLQHLIRSRFTNNTGPNAPFTTITLYQVKYTYI